MLDGAIDDDDAELGDLLEDIAFHDSENASEIKGMMHKLRHKVVVNLKKARARIRSDKRKADALKARRKGVGGLRCGRRLKQKAKRVPRL